MTRNIVVPGMSVDRIDRAIRTLQEARSVFVARIIWRPGVKPPGPKDFDEVARLLREAEFDAGTAACAFEGAAIGTNALTRTPPAQEERAPGCEVCGGPSVGRTLDDVDLCMVHAPAAPAVQQPARVSFAEWKPVMVRLPGALVDAVWFACPECHDATLSGYCGRCNLRAATFSERAPVTARPDPVHPKASPNPAEAVGHGKVGRAPVTGQER